MISQTQNTNTLLLLAKAGIGLGGAQFGSNQKAASVNLFSEASEEDFELELSELLNVGELEQEVNPLIQTDEVENSVGPNILLALNEIGEGEGIQITPNTVNTVAESLELAALELPKNPQISETLDITRTTPQEAEIVLSARETLNPLKLDVPEIAEEGLAFESTNQNLGTNLDLATTLEQHVDAEFIAAPTKETTKVLELADATKPVVTTQVEQPNIPIRAVAQNGAVLSLQQFEPNVAYNNPELSINGSTSSNKNPILLSKTSEVSSVTQELQEGESETFQVAEAEESPFGMFETDAEEVILYEEVDGKTEYVKFKADLPQLEAPEIAFKESESIQLASLDAKEQYTKLLNPGDLPEQIKFEVSQAIESKNDVVKFILNPANLGEVEIKFITDPITKELNVSILSEKYATLDILNELSKEIENIIQEAHNGSADISLNLGLQERSRNFHEMVASHIANQEDGEKLAQASDVYTSSISLASIITEGGLNIVV